MDCSHVLADENGLCIDCGNPAPDDTIRLNAADVRLLAESGGSKAVIIEVPPQADIPAIVKLAEFAIQEYQSQLIEMQDPADCKLVRICKAGVTFYRPTWLDLWNEIVQKTHMGALLYGYRSSRTRWNEFLKDTIQYQRGNI